MEDAAMVAPYPDACMLKTSLDVDFHRSTCPFEQDLTKQDCTPLKCDPAPQKSCSQFPMLIAIS